MINISGITQLIEQLKREIQREGADIVQRKAALQVATKDKQALDFLMKTKETEVRLKESEIQRLKNEIQQTQTKVMEADQNIQKINYNIARIEREQSSKNQQLVNAQRDVENAKASLGRSN
jgi:multidrug resistance efflux pump